MSPGSRKADGFSGAGPGAQTLGAGHVPPVLATVGPSLPFPLLSTGREVGGRGAAEEGEWGCRPPARL